MKRIVQSVRYQFLLLVLLAITYLLFNMNNSAMLNPSSLLLFDTTATTATTMMIQMKLLLDQMDQVGGLHREQLQHIVSHVRREPRVNSRCDSDSTSVSSSSSSSTGSNILIWLSSDSTNSTDSD